MGWGRSATIQMIEVAERKTENTLGKKKKELKKLSQN